MDELTKEEIELIIEVIGKKVSVPLLSKEADIIRSIIMKLQLKLDPNKN